MEDCGVKCDADSSCTGFTFEKPKNGGKTFDCYLRNNSNTNIDKRIKTYYSYDKNTGGGAASGTTDATTSAECPVKLFEHGDFVSGREPTCVPEGEHGDLGVWTDIASAIQVHPGYTADVFDEKNFNAGKGDLKFATITGNHLLWDEEMKKNAPTGSNQGWSDHIASIKVRKLPK